MLKIRTPQYHALRELWFEKFLRDIAADIRVNCPAETADLSDEELERRVKLGFRRASRFGFTKKYSLAFYIELMFIAAPNFDEYPPVRHILWHPDIPPDEKLDRVVETLAPAFWEDIRRRADPSIWERGEGAKPNGEDAP